MEKIERKNLILVVEDDSDILLNLKILLEFNNFKVETAENGFEALEKLKILYKSQNLPDLILSDIIMPNLDGYELVKIISNYRPLADIPFIFLSGLSFPEEINIAKTLGVNDYITKPFDIDDLLSKINSKIKKPVIIESKNQIQSIPDSILFQATNNNQYNFSINKIYPKTNFSSKFIYSISNKLQEQKEKLMTKNEEEEIYQESVFIKINNSKYKGIFLFDNEDYQNNNYLILGFISNDLSYFDYLRIKKIQKEIMSIIISEKNWDIRKYLEQIKNDLKIKSDYLAPASFINPYLTIK